MNRTIMPVFAVLLTLLLVTASCSVQPTNITEPSATVPSGTTAPSVTEPSGSQAGRGTDLMAGIIAAPRTGTVQVPDEATRAGISRFAAELLLSCLQDDGNVMVSPASVFLALAMTANGARGETEKAMLQVLVDADINISQLNETARDLIALLEKAEDKTKVSVANSIWFREGFAADLSFLQRNADYFGAGARQLDFADDTSKDIINAWVKEATNNLIDSIVDQISPTTVMFLINAIYFKADWLTPFEKHDTWAQAFNTPTGSIDTDFMHRTDQMLYFTDDKISGVSLPYANEQFAYFAILPDDGMDLRTYLASQDTATLFTQINTWMTQAELTPITLALPRYKASYEKSLVETLKSMGMAVAFDGAQADFSGLNAAGSSGLYISEVKHKTVISVDEKGTEAAAVTSVVIDESANWAEIELVFDRPFLYGIMDLQTNLPLFVGILENPAAE